MPSRIIAIGDVHGCSTALDALINAFEPTRDDLIVPLGDYVDRGPDSKGVIDRMIELATDFDVKPILGNHEEMMLTVLNGDAPPDYWLRYGGIHTLDSYGFSGSLDVVPDSHREFLQRCLDFVETGSHIFLHANYREDVPLEALDREHLRWLSLADEMPGPHMTGKTAVVGHTPDKTGEIMDVGYLACIDTFCYGGQWLTAMDMLSRTVWQANEKGQLREL